MAHRLGTTEYKFTRDNPNKKIVNYCQKLGIPALDLLEEITTAEQDQSLYFKIDGHWTVQGNSLAAEKIYQFLKEAHLVGKVNLQYVEHR